MIQLAAWSATALSLFGVVLNIRRRRECFYVWAATNAWWAGFDAWNEIWSQATLQAIYFGLAIWGLIEWKTKYPNLSGNSSCDNSPNATP